MSTSPTRRTPVASTMAVLASLTLAATANAATFEWNVDADGDWNDQANWAGATGFPNSTADNADVLFNITADRTITVPDVTGNANADFVVNSLEVGDASHKYTIAGPGKLDLGKSSGNLNSLQIRNGGVVQLDADAIFRTFPNVNGSGTIIVNGTIDAGGQDFDFNNGITARINNTIQNVKWDQEVLIQTALEVGFDGEIAGGNAPVELGTASTIRTFGGDRILDDRLATQPLNGQSFSGVNGNLTVTGRTTFVGQNSFDGDFTVADGTLNLAGGVNWANSGGDDHYIIESGATLEISGTGNTYTDQGKVDIRGNGTFLLNNADGSATGTGNTLEIASGITLGGDGGTESSVLVEGGTVAPGNSIGDLSLGTTTFQAGSTLDIEFSPTDSDTLIVDGDLVLSNVENLNLLGTADTNNTYTIATYTGTLSGTFDNVDFGTTGFVLSDIDYGDGTNDAITITGFVIPEPAAAGLVILGGLTMLGRRRRREA